MIVLPQRAEITIHFLKKLIMSIENKVLLHIVIFSSLFRVSVFICVHKLSNATATSNLEKSTVIKTTFRNKKQNIT